MAASSISCCSSSVIPPPDPSSSSSSSPEKRRRPASRWASHAGVLTGMWVVGVVVEKEGEGAAGEAAVGGGARIQGSS